MSDSGQPQINPTAALYSYRLGQAASDLMLIANRLFEAAELRKHLLYLNFYARRIRSTLPVDGTEIGRRWWQRYGQFFAMVEDLKHPEFDDDFDALWVSLRDPN
ncbi:MAG TPA: hypothetical protein VMU84_04250 [Thermoanaerobaculia bacterium]|nr:hypothetical protein [Thermoanaerobaculia bacterium]